MLRETRQIDFVLLDDAEDMDYYFGKMWILTIKILKNVGMVKGIP